MNILSISDLNLSFGPEPRVAHINLADALGYVQHLKLRHLVERNSAEFERYGSLSSTVDGSTGGRPAQVIWLNEGQAILAAVKSNTPRAAEVRHQVITVFMAWRQSQAMVPVKAHERRPSTRLEDAIRLKTNVDRLEFILQTHERAEMMDTVREMLRDMRQRNEAHCESMRITAVAIEDMIEGRQLALG